MAGTRGRATPDAGPIQAGAGVRDARSLGGPAGLNSYCGGLDFDPVPWGDLVCRDFLCPGGGSLRIVDGRVTVVFTGQPVLPDADPNYFDVQRLPSDPVYGLPYPPVAANPQVAAFVAAEQLTVVAEFPPFKAMFVDLPAGTSVEHAVYAWPLEYPGLLLAVEPDVLYSFAQDWDPNDDAFTDGSQWNLLEASARDVNIEPLWRSHTWGNPASSIAVIDSGVQRSHGDLATRLLPYGANACGNPWSLTCTAGGGQPYATSYDYNDQMAKMAGHGTAVTGVACAALSDDVPGTLGDEHDVAGICPWNMAFPIAMEYIWDPAAGSCLGGPVFESRVLISSYYAVGLTKRVWRADEAYSSWPYYSLEAVNMSFCGYYTGPDNWTLLETQMVGKLGRYLNLAAAAGNSALTGDPPVYPARYPQVLCVAAYMETDLASFTNYQTYVDVIAPGVRIQTPDMTGASPAGYLLGFSPRLGWDRWGINGTSVAAPHVAACAALIAGLYPALTPSQISARIVNHNIHGDLPLDTQNFGRLDIWSSVVGP